MGTQTLNLPLLAAAATGVQVGAAIVATRTAVTDVAPLTLAMLRYGIGFLCHLPFVIQQNRSLAHIERAKLAIQYVALIDLLAMAALGIELSPHRTSPLTAGCWRRRLSSAAACGWQRGKQTKDWRTDDEPESC